MLDRVLIVEDDADIASLIRVNLQELGIHTEHFDDGKQAYQIAVQQDWDLLLLDIMLPGMSGLDICRQVRQLKPQQAILMLTAKNSETDRVLGLELGADDYMTKPFSVRELQARVRSQLRRAKLLQSLSQDMPTENQHQIVIGSLVIDPLKHQVFIQQHQLELTVTEFDLLQYLARHPNQVFNRAQLLEAVWGYHHSGYEHTVNSHINRLRAKIEHEVTAPKIVQTVWGIGYKLNPAGLL
ncbi:response regulator [Neptunicella sp. SCSIO 80796]|uniref:response regulator n=1 Tax=Neptunicella plasticusilytica TaxID=3117012 RepID=UPI003A4E0F81